MSVYRRHRHGFLHRSAAAWISSAYFVALALIAFWPTPVDRGVHGSIETFEAWLHAHGFAAWFGYDTIEFSANIALFVPVGLLVVAWAGARRWWFGPLTGTVVSSAIELGQLAFLPQRFATVNDIVANGIGALLGSLVAVVVLRLALGPTREPVHAVRYN